jgi:hypothetical protein
VASARKGDSREEEILLMFQDEAHYRRLSSPRTCWALLPVRPLINFGVIREFRYIYAFAIPITDHLHYIFDETKLTLGERKPAFAKEAEKLLHKNIFILYLAQANENKLSYFEYRKIISKGKNYNSTED